MSRRLNTLKKVRVFRLGIGNMIVMDAIYISTSKKLRLSGMPLTRSDTMTQYQWVLCPICRGKTRTKIRPDTEAKNLIVFCPKCKKETVMDIKDMESKAVGE